MKSKYQNPDKFINTLKARIEWLEEQASDDYRLYVKERGKQILTWKSDQTNNVSCLSQDLGVLRPGDTIHQIDKVTKVVIEQEKSSVELIRLEIRKVDD